MKELSIHEFEAKQIEDTFRMIANVMGSRTEKTCVDRQVMKSIKMIKRVLAEKPYAQ